MCRYRDGYFNVGSRTHGRDTFLCADKEKHPKEIRPYAAYFLRSSVLTRAIPAKTSGTRRGKTGDRGDVVGCGELVNPNIKLNNK
ncbi:hypothetical protein MGMO_8c01020 [Methyloglobulus morosus KoM1]|uniref:Uncharacterized protein n=1 Tax=Methyloglobulus morosus KoM1 TaxID=1116472 RepID=V5BKW4_9GAMM|nr:hypothetical protein [Methyloglobulus morosus]ESS73965.1 hypothetical protein MGMO_8c01020 [Methyloglobulus morosus KoM1]